MSYELLGTIEFEKNWNNKLMCDYFTTIRPALPAKYQIGGKYQININGKFALYAECVLISDFKIQQLTNSMAFTDAAMPARELSKLFGQWWPDIDFSLRNLSYITLKRLP